MSHKKIKVLKGIVVDGDTTIENGAEGVLTAADAEALAVAEIVEVLGDAPAPAAPAQPAAKPAAKAAKKDGDEL
jgi:hypothetical protein